MDLKTDDDNDDKECTLAVRVDPGNKLVDLDGGKPQEQFLLTLIYYNYKHHKPYKKSS